MTNSIPQPSMAYIGTACAPWSIKMFIAGPSYTLTRCVASHFVPAMFVRTGVIEAKAPTSRWHEGIQAKDCKPSPLAPPGPKYPSKAFWPQGHAVGLTMGEKAETLRYWPFYTRRTRKRHARDTPSTATADTEAKVHSVTAYHCANAFIAAYRFESTDECSMAAHAMAHDGCLFCANLRKVRLHHSWQLLRHVVEHIVIFLPWVSGRVHIKPSPRAKIIRVVFSGNASASGARVWRHERQP